MAEDNRSFIWEIIEDLKTGDMRKLKAILNRKKIGNCKLDNLDAIKATGLFMAHFDKPLEELKCILDEIPRKDLIKKVNDKIEADMRNNGEAQNNETFAVINSCPGSSDHPTYTGKYTLFDLEDYATKNQDQLIMDLENILEPDEFNELKKQLMCSVLNTFFSFTAQKYYELFKNGEVKEFFQNIPDKPKKIPMKILNILFSKKKDNRKRKVQEQMQREGNINLKKKRFVDIDDDDDSVPDKVTIGIKNEKIIPIHPIEHKPGNEDSNVIEEHGLGKDSRMATENRYEKNENEKTIPIHPIEHKPGNEESNVIEEHGLGEDSRMATENRYEKNENEKIPIHPIEHKPGNEASNVIKEHGLSEDSRMATENRYEKNENEKTIPIHPIEHKPGNEESNVIEEHGLGEDSRMATENRYEKNENEKITIHPIEHKPGNEESNVIEEHGLGEDSRMATENRYEKNENEKTIPIHPIEHKPGNEESNVIEEHGLGEDSRTATENRYEKNENEKTIPIHPIEHKPGNEESNVIEEHGLGEDSRMATENRYEKNENEKIPIHPIQHKPGNEDSNVIEEYWPDEDSRMAIEKWYEKKIKNNYREKISLNYICIQEHKAYACFTAQDVLQFKLPDDTDYRILAILQEKRDLTNSRKLKKEVEFALQFNMAVLNVQFSEVISSKEFIDDREADGSFAKSEGIFKNIVFKIVLPLLALYKRVKLNAFDNAVYPNKESKSSFSEKL